MDYIKYLTTSLSEAIEEKYKSVFRMALSYHGIYFSNDKDLIRFIEKNIEHTKSKQGVFVYKIKNGKEILHHIGVNLYPFKLKLNNNNVSIESSLGYFYLPKK